MMIVLNNRNRLHLTFFALLFFHRHQALSLQLWQLPATKLEITLFSKCLRGMEVRQRATPSPNCGNEAFLVINFSLVFVAYRLIEQATVLLPFCKEFEIILGQSEITLATCALKSSWHLGLPVSAMVKRNSNVICKNKFQRECACIWNIFSHPVSF